MATETKSKINASTKRAIRKKVDEAGKDHLYDYDRIAARHQAIRQLASEHKVSVAEVQEVLRGRDDESGEPSGAPTSDELADLGPAPVDTRTPAEQVDDPALLQTPDAASAEAHQAAPTTGEVDKENKQLAREQEKEDRREEREAKREEAKQAPAKKAPAKAAAKAAAKAPAKKAPAKKTSGPSGSSARR